MSCLIDSVFLFLGSDFFMIWVLFGFCSLTVLPSEVCSLPSLKQLDVANNKLTSLPNEMGLLTQLEILKANNNRHYTYSFK